jgi:hypothetical protein
MKKDAGHHAQRLSSPRQSKALLLLIKGPRSVRELFDKIPCNGVPQLIASLRAKGLQIDRDERKTLDLNNRPVTYYCVYVLNHRSHRQAFRLLAEYGELADAG